jgi:uncharacterized protein (UPF0332 family)
MSDEAQKYWRRSQLAMTSARKNIEIDEATACNRAYYAAFYAVSALFALEDKRFKRHTGVEAAVHRDLVSTGRWPTELGATYSKLYMRRTASDYDIEAMMSIEEAEDAVERAAQIVQAVQNLCPELHVP